LWKSKPLTYPDLFIKNVVNYHGSTIERGDGNAFNCRISEHQNDKTIYLAQEEMTPVLVGNKESVELIEALAQVACKLFCKIILILLQCLVNAELKVKNSQLELLPLIGQSTEVIETGFRTLLHALRHLFDEKVASLSHGQLSLNCQQYENLLECELQECRNLRLMMSNVISGSC
jgi:hypothetical protein